MKNSRIVLYAIIALVIIILVGGGIYLATNNEEGAPVLSISNTKSIKNEIITAENYEELMNKIEKELANDEELYYLSYSSMYYIMQDGLASALSGSEDDTAMYTRIYGKTVQQLVDEGKQLMKDNGITIEEFKTNLEELSNTSIE